MNGLMNVAPAFAASSACSGEKHSVTFVITPSPDSVLHARIPSCVSGSLMHTLDAIFRSTAASRIMPS